MPALPFRQTLAAGLLVVAPLILSVALPGALSAQTILTVSPQQCVWHAGDDPAWAAPNLDETGWQPYANWKLNPAEPRIWIRCHADLSSLRPVDQPALQVTLYAAYQIFADGRLIGTAGNLQSGVFTMDAVRTWPLPGDLSHPVSIALRITFHLASMVPNAPLPPLEINAAGSQLLSYRRSSLILAGVRRNLIPAICFSIIGIIGIFLLGLYLNDRSRRDLQLLSANCIMLAPIYLNYLGVAALLPYSAILDFTAWGAPALVANVTRALFFFVLARKRVPWLFWALIGLSIVLYPVALAVPLLPPAQALWLDTLRSHQIAAIAEFAAVLESLAPFAAFRPWTSLTPRTKPLAALCMAWGATMMSFFAVRFTSAHIPGVPDLQARWGNTVADAEAFITLCVLVVLLALLFREQQQTAKDRAVLAGEMQAASEIQQMLAPAQIDTAPGLKIDVAFHPMREVGGDFYLCRVLTDGRQRVLIGDVSGKGAAAAMAATLLLGAAAARDSDSPANLLSHLNRVLCENHLSGFATSLCADVTPSGMLIVANAGHLPPYCEGREIELDSGLPLGIASESEYGETTLRLDPGSQVTLLSDGIVEARSPKGELFGFDRACGISKDSAPNIASAAQRFGQEDDITVLTLKLLPVPSDGVPMAEPVPFQAEA
jgi:sigma-B regulation protein RsbU (phosphoserine phosphatase)